MQTFKDLFRELGGVGAVAEALGVTYDGALKMRARESVPPKHWPKLVEMAAAKGVRGVTIASLAQIAVKKRAA